MDGYTQSEIWATAKERAAECAKESEVRWECSCGKTAVTDNMQHSLRCSCGYWMKWQYPVAA